MTKKLIPLILASLFLMTCPIPAMALDIKGWPKDARILIASTTPAAKSATASPDVGTPLPAAPVDVKDALKTSKDAIGAAKSGKWWYFSALVVTLIIFGLKLAGLRFGFWKKMGRWRYVIPPVLSIAASLLATFQGGVSAEAALGVFTSSYSMSSLQELYEHGILGKPRASAGEAKKDSMGSA